MMYRAYIEDFFGRRILWEGHNLNCALAYVNTFAKDLEFLHTCIGIEVI